MPLVSQNVWKKIRETFDDVSTQKEIAEILNLYKDNERERVQLYILYLAKENKDEIYELVDAANQDYRNIIFWAENLEEAQINTPEKKRQMNELFQCFGLEFSEKLKEAED